MGARRQTLAHKQRMPTSQGGTDKYAFCAPYDGHFVDNKQSHCRPVIRSSSQSENTTHVSREEFARDVSNSSNLCDRVNQAENALTKMIESLTGVIAKFENLVNGMSCSNDTKSKQNSTDLPHVFVSSSQSEDNVENLSSKGSPQNVDERVDRVDPVVCKDEVHLVNQNSPVQNSACYNQGKEIDSSVVLHNVVAEVDPQVFEVANVEESDVVFEDAQVDVCDVLDHDDVKITELVVNDSIVAGSHLTKSVTGQASPIAANKEAIEETNQGDIVSSEQTQFLNGINSPFHTKDSTISVNIAHLNFRALIDTGAAVTAVSARVWQRCSSNISLNLGPPNHDSITTVDGCLLKVIGRVMLPFAIDFKIFRSEAHVIQDLTSDVILGRNFFEKFCAKIDFDEGMIRFKHGEDPLPFDSDPVTIDNDYCPEFVCSVHADTAFTIPPQSEIIVLGRLNAELPLKETVCGLVVPRNDLPHRYSIFGASELVKVTEDGTIPVRMVNPSARPVKIFRKTRLGDFESVDNRIETFQLSEAPEEFSYSLKTMEKADYSEFPDLSDSVLSEADKIKFGDLFQSYRDVFAFTDDQLGKTSLVQHVIATGDALPIKQRPYRTSPKCKQEIDRQVEDMLQKGIIRESVSPWSSPVVLVKKKDGSFRFCVDLRKVNAVTRKDSFPMPLVSDTLDALSGTKYFSTLDLKSGYWQIEMRPESREKTAFVTHNGLYEFNVMPFGLTNSGASFQRLMGHILRGLEYRFALIYIDDIVIFSKSIDEHLTHLEEVFRRLREANVKLNPKKCSFVKQRIEYLGHVVTPEGIFPDPGKVEVVKNFPTPASLKELKSFLGLANYYRRFIKGFSEIASPLNALTKKGVKFCWSESCAVAFDRLKRTLTSAPVLAFPNFDEQFLLYVDASSTGIGFALAQIQNGKEVVIAYNGRGLNQAERNYTTTEREALALVEGIKKFQPYLHDRKFVVYTDHSSLRWLMNVKDATGRLARWALLLQQYNFDIIHRPGCQNGNADALSRRPYPTTNLNALQQSDPDIDKIREKQRKDPELSERMDYIQNDVLPSNDAKARRILLRSDSFYISQDGLLCHLDRSQKRARDSFSQLVVPQSMKYEILSNVHNHVAGAHFGVHKTFQKLKQRYWWSGMFKDVEHWCKSCVDCAMKKSPRNTKRAPLLPLPVEGAFDRVAVDVLGPFKPSNRQNRYIVVFSDYLTRWCEAFPVPSVEANVIARLLVDEIIARHGAPRVLLSDRGTNFLSKLVAEVCKIFQIQKVNTSSYHPQTDGLVERFNSTLCQSLSMYVAKNQKDWDDFIPLILFAHRTSISEAIGDCPFYCLYGREPRLPVDVKFLPPAADDLSTSVLDHRKRVVEKVELAQNLARENIQRSQQKMKEYYDRNTSQPLFEIGQRVWVYTPKTKKGLSKKLLYNWFGPYRIVEQSSPVHYRLRTIISCSLSVAF